MHKIDLNRCRQSFLREADEYISEMESALAAQAEDHDRGRMLNTIFRAAQWIKGGAGTFGYREVASFAWTVESLIGFIRAGQVALTRPLIYLLLLAVDMLGALLANARDTQIGRPAESVLVCVHLQPLNA